MFKSCVFLLAVVFAVQASLPGQERTLKLEFTPETPRFEAATEEYRRIWEEQGSRIVVAMEKATGLRFKNEDIRVIVYEGTSFSGYGATPMQLRASYPANTKKATLVHELGHRLLSTLPSGDSEQHPALFLFLHEVWVDLWGKDFAAAEVKVESARRGLYDYKGAWKRVLKMTPAERSSKFKDYVQKHSKR